MERCGGSVFSRVSPSQPLSLCLRLPSLLAAKFNKLQSKEHPDSEATLHKAHTEEDKMNREYCSAHLPMEEEDRIRGVTLPTLCIGGDSGGIEGEGGQK